MQWQGGPVPGAALEISLRQGHLLRLYPKAPMRLNCRRGCLLVTVQRDFVDHELHPGDELQLPAACSVLLDGTGTFSLSHVPPGGLMDPPWRWQRLLSALQTSVKRLRPGRR